MLNINSKSAHELANAAFEKQVMDINNENSTVSRCLKLIKERAGMGKFKACFVMGKTSAITRDGMIGYLREQGYTVEPKKTSLSISW